MRKKVIFSIVFVLLAGSICLFIINEYLKRIEIKAIETYLNTLYSEFSKYYLKADTNLLTCYGFLKHTCVIKEAKISNKEYEVLLKNINIKMVNLTQSEVGIEISVENISHILNSNPYFILTPKYIKYTLNLKKEDSALGYVMLNRKIYLDFSKFDINIDLDILLRGELFRNKSIIFLLQDWFNTNTPSFYEYSVENLNIDVKSKEIGDYYKKNLARFDISLNGIFNDFKKQINKFYNGKDDRDFKISIFNNVMDSTYKVLNGDTNSLKIDVKRKNNKLVFFNLLSKEASLKKMLEIRQVLDSLNPTYDIKIETK
ncbi:MAG: hypothetical protein K2P17_07940 [Helicobacteraceae bacterium]|nr:hypothetical protein [Helicobacteraceae bacterium]